MILGAAYRSITLNEEGILMGQGKVITMEDAHRAGLGEIFDRVVVELVGKMDEMKMVRKMRLLMIFYSQSRKTDILHGALWLERRFYCFKALFGY